MTTLTGTQRNMDQIPRSGYYYDSYGYPTDTRLGNPVYFDGGPYAWPGFAPPPVVPASLFPPSRPQASYRQVPDNSRSVEYGDNQIVADTRKPQLVRPAQAVTTKNLTEAELRRITDSWQQPGSEYTSVIVGGTQNSKGDTIFPAEQKTRQWRITQSQQVIPSTKEKRITASNIKSEPVYPGAASGYEYQLPTRGYPVPPAQFVYPTPMTTLGGYYRPSPEINYDPYLAYY